MCKKEMDWASGYFGVFPGGFAHWRDPKWPKDEPFLYIRETCPPDIRERILKEWPRIVKETKERHKKGIFSSTDYF